MKAIQFIALAATISVLSVACSDSKKPENTQPTVEVVKAPTISEQTSALNASVDSAWHAVIQVDSQKFANIKRLVEEISYCKKYDEKGVAKALKLITEIRTFQYTQDNLSDSIITLYDTKTDELIRFVRNLKGNTKEISQHPLADQLDNEIMEADNQLVNYRSRYDVLANEYNSFLDANKEAIGTKKRLFSVPA
ncbi:hypothetical protein [Cytophaga aurantiaca]|uniref:hypothetical protein n=1 Tax=Cytophaga aurantiaca TaxID=29530 RepID=UPI00036C0043|nr:hypothetical protein [Cytophaga aurantiaca]